MDDVWLVGNDWSALRVPELGGWRPELSVSVVIPARDCQPSLDLTLASLARQSYPEHLLEVVVVDDGSEPPLALPKIRPLGCKLVRVATGWGRANALHLGVQHSTGEIIHWLDADMVVYPQQVEAQARWHHQVRYAVTLGWKRFVDVTPSDAAWPTPDEVADGADKLFAGLPSQPHDYVERTIARTNGLREADHLAYLVHVGATAALRRELYQASGGLDPRLRLGEDTELGYRLAQAGAVFIPEPAAQSWHLGRSHMMQQEKQLQRYNRPFLADAMPLPRWLRRVGGSRWAVPLVTVVMSVDRQPLERVRAAVDSVLAGDETDLEVALIGPWRSIDDRRRVLLSDPQLELELIAASYRSDPRVRKLECAPASVFPSPYLLRVPVTCGLARPAIRRLLDYADQERLGLVRVSVRPGTQVELWRTAALGRAGWVRRDDEPLADVVAEVAGVGTLPARAAGVVDLSRFSPAQLADGAGAALAGVGGTATWLPRSVEVAGVRSLARATALVARLAVGRARARLRR